MRIKTIIYWKRKKRIEAKKEAKKIEQLHITYVRWTLYNDVCAYIYKNYQLYQRRSNRSEWQILKCSDSVELHRGKCYVNYCHTLVSSRDYGKKRERNEDNDVKDDEVKENDFITAIFLFLSSLRVFAIISTIIYLSILF